MVIGIILHGRPTVMRRLLIRSKRRVLIASDYLERALAPGRASTRQSWQGATDRDRSRPLVPCREVVSRNWHERSGCSRVDTGNWARTGRDRSRPVRKSVVWTRPLRLLQVSMDWPSVNWKFYTDLARERKPQELPGRTSEHRQLKSHGNSLNCHGKVMELYHQISVGTLMQWRPATTCFVIRWIGCKAVDRASRIFCRQGGIIT